jgi:3-isopropylmalate/(R)-2-methylmalate dehydratase small subunit
MADFNGALRGGRIPPGSVIAAGKNFGCGSSREQAVSALKGHELTIVGRSFARIFLQNAINLGLRIVTAPGLEAAEGDEVSVRGETVVNETSGASSPVVKLPQARQAIIDAGGLIPFTRKRLLQGATSGDSHH